MTVVEIRKNGRIVREDLKERERRVRASEDMPEDVFAAAHALFSRLPPKPQPMVARRRPGRRPVHSTRLPHHKI